MNTYQEEIDKKYAESLGYNVNIDYNHDLEYENINDALQSSFDYEKKTKEYFESFYY